MSDRRLARAHLGEARPRVDHDDLPFGAPRHLPIEVERRAACTVVHVVGELVAGTAPALQTCLRGLADGGTVEVVVDLTDVPYCDDIGLGVLVGAHRRLHQGGGHLWLHDPGPQVRHTLEEHGLDRVLDVS